MSADFRGLPISVLTYLLKMSMTEGHCNDQGMDLTGYRFSTIDLENGSGYIQIL